MFIVLHPANVSDHNDGCMWWLEWPVGSVCFASVLNEDKCVVAIETR